MDGILVHCRLPPPPLHFGGLAMVILKVPIHFAQENKDSRHTTKGYQTSGSGAIMILTLFRSVDLFPLGITQTF